MRIAGVNIPDEKKVEVSLTYIYGIGKNSVYRVIENAGIDPNKRTRELTEDEIIKIQKALDSYKIEGDLRADIVSNVKRLKDVSSYRGVRHSKGLPVKGQRTRSNARTKRGRRVTIGSVKKDK